MAPKAPLEIKVMGVYSCLDRIPGLHAEDMLAFKQRHKRWRKHPDIAHVLIRNRRP
jgi:hypothetical protein